MDKIYKFAFSEGLAVCWTWQFGNVFAGRRPIGLEAQSAFALNDVASSVVSVYTQKDRIPVQG